MLRRIPCLLAVCFFVLACSEDKSQTYAQIREQLQGDQILAAGPKANAAELEIAQAKTEDADDPAAQYNLAVLALKARNLDKALPPAARAYELRPDDNAIRELYAYVLQQKGDTNRAVQLWEEMINSGQPFQHMIHNNLCNAYKSQKKYAKAEEQCLKALEDENLLVAEYVHINLADLWIQQGRYQEARESVNKALKIDPDVAFAHHQLGKIALLEGNFEDAVTELEQEAQRRARAWETYQLLAQAYAHLQPPKMDKAEEAIAEIATIRPGYKAYSQAILGELYAQAGQYEKALAVATEALSGMAVPQKDQRNLAYAVMALAAHQLGQKDKATEYYQEFKKTLPAINTEEPMNKRRIHELETLFGGR